MTDTRTKLRKYADAGRPLIEQSLDIAEEFKAIRDAARNDGIDWASVKALIKAQILDDREGTDKRVKAIIDKADFASAYADMLGMSNNLSEKRKTRDGEPSGNSGQLHSAPEKPADTIEPAAVTVSHLVLNSTPHARLATPDDLSIPADGSIPPFLDRRPEQEALS